MPALSALFAMLLLALPSSSAQAAEEAKLVPADGAPRDQFGGTQSVAVSGDTAVIGAFGDDDNGAGSGSAYVFRFDGTTWVEEAKLLASDGAPKDQFGGAVGVFGDTIVVSASGDDHNGGASGSAYVFRFDGTTWIEEAKLVASDGDAFDQFAGPVAVSGDTIVVGASRDDDNGAQSGSAYVFRFNGVTWVEEAKLLASDGAASDSFGVSVAVSGGTSVIGAIGDDVNGHRSGSAYVFRFDGTTWVEEAKLVPSDGFPLEGFGTGVAVFGDVAVIAAPSDDGIGSAYVFRFDGTSWVEEAKLLPSDGSFFDFFGFHAVAIFGGTIVIGSSLDDDNGRDSGSAYVFRFNGTSWVEEAKLLASDGADFDIFGESVALSGDAAVIGASFDDDNGAYSGAAYVFRLSPGLARCEANLSEALVRLDRCLADPPFSDADGDGEHDDTDRCPGTPAGDAIDESGCSREQFCRLVVLRRPRSVSRCISSDWRNDQSLEGNPMDCIANLRRRECVAR